MSWSLSAIATSVISISAIINFPTIILEEMIIHDMVSPSRDRKEPYVRRFDHHQPSSHSHGDPSRSRVDARGALVAPARRRARAAGSASRRACLRGRAGARREGARREGARTLALG